MSTKNTAVKTLRIILPAAQLTPAVVEQVRTAARAKGYTQSGFKTAKDAQWYRIELTDPPAAPLGEMGGNPIDRDGF